MLACSIGDFDCHLLPLTRLFGRKNCVYIPSCAVGNFHFYEAVSFPELAIIVGLLAIM